jgi:endonuclease/exonuclease/phosphatase (EEP) superfamily protein YafD
VTDRVEPVRQDVRVPTLRVLSVDARTTGSDRAGLARLISDHDPDAVCVHNAPQLGRWRQKVARLARESGRVVICADGRRAGGNLLLSTLGVDVVTTSHARFTSDSRLAPPGAALALLRVDGREFVLVSTTLIGNAAVRLGQAAQLQAAIDRFVPGAPPAIVSAIGTDRPGTAAWQAVADGRVVVGARFFVDERIAVDEAQQLGKGQQPTGATTAVLATLTV